jgi:septal ring factor EnvC (AmiA/AmiB activator)
VKNVAHGAEAHHEQAKAGLRLQSPIFAQRRNESGERAASVRNSSGTIKTGRRRAAANAETMERARKRRAKSRSEKQNQGATRNKCRPSQENCDPFSVENVQK